MKRTKRIYLKHTRYKNEQKFETERGKATRELMRVYQIHTLYAVFPPESRQLCRVVLLRQRVKRLETARFARPLPKACKQRYLILKMALPTGKSDVSSENRCFLGL